MPQKIFRNLFCVLFIISSVLWIVPAIYGVNTNKHLVLAPAEVRNTSLPATKQNLDEVLDEISDSDSNVSPSSQPIQPVAKVKSNQSSKILKQPKSHASQRVRRLNSVQQPSSKPIPAQKSQYYPAQYSKMDHLAHEMPKTPELGFVQSAVQQQRKLGVGPEIQIGGEHSSEFGAILNTKFGYQLDDRMAGALEGDIGSKEYRLGLTWAFMPTAHQEMKITVEHLAQKMKFDFASGEVMKWMGQNAIGADYEYLFSNQRFFDQVTLNNLGVSGYYSKASSKNFNPILFQQDDYWYWDYRHIAGGTAKELQLNVGFLPWRWGSVKLGAGYSAVDYDMKYEKDKKSSGLGGSVDLEQLLSEQLKFDLNANLQRAYDDYKGGVSYLMHTKPDSRLELGITAEHIRGHLSLPNDNRFGVNVGYIWGANPAEGLASYHMAQENQNFSSQLLNWTMTPAVHMAKVLAIKDEKVVWTPKDPTSTPIDDNWTAVGAMFHYDVSSHFQANGDQGIFAYSLISTIAHALGADEKVDLGIDQNSGLISSNETVSTDAVDTRITVSADKISRGQKIGPTQNQSFTVYVEPTSRQAIITIPSVTTEFACFIDINSPDSNKGDFKSHGGQLVYQLSGDDSGLTINATTGKITGAKPPGITDHIHVTAYKKDAPDTGNHTTTWTFRIECIKIPIPPIPA